MKPLAALILAGTALAAPQSTDAAEQRELEQEFEKLMTGCRMVGQFTMRDPKKPAQQESYTIRKVRKLKGSRWRFFAQIQYAGRDVTVPLVVDVKWAGDTPMIQVTDMAIPMLGTYSARVLIYRNEYAGTWSGKNYGGQMFGRIERDPTVKVRGAKKKTSSNWGNWRGPNHNGVGDGKPPRKWSEKDGQNIKWIAPLPGKGSSSPLVWDDRVYVTTAIPTDRDGAALDAPQGGRRRGGFGGGATPTKIHEFVVLAFDRSTGKEVWRRKVIETVPHEAGHNTASQVSNSSITDGEHIYAYFGSRGLYCLDMAGEVQWSKNFGKMRTSVSFGEGSSPALHGDTLVVNWDHEGSSFIAGFDKRTGKQLWRQPRRQGTTWATPLIVPVDGRHQVVVPGSRRSRAYDLATGEEVWSTPGLTSNPIPTPLFHEGLVYVMSGYQGHALQAIRLAGAKGNLSGTDHVAWTHARNTPYTPSGIVYKGLLYCLRSNNGVLSCFDAKTGKPHFEGQRLRRIGTTYSSIVGADDHLYITSRRGWTKVVKVGPTFEDVGENRLNDTIDASAALAGDEIFFRGWTKLYCIAETK